MPVICPTVTATNLKDYRHQLEEVQPFANRLHIDFMDGVFVPVKSVPPKDAWWHKGPIVDLHVMHARPSKVLEDLISLQPQLIILHAESDDIDECLAEIHNFGIKTGLAILQDTPVDTIKEYLINLDHLMLFSGNLGHFGGRADLSLLKKVQEIRSLKQDIELGWDGGVSIENAGDLVNGGIDVLNVGGFIHKASNPEDAYDKLVEALPNRRV